MKKFNKSLAALVITSMALTGCSRVAPNHVGVLMENYGKNGQSDFTLQQGTVWTIAPGSELFVIPLYEQKGQFASPMHLKANDNTEFTSAPSYSYKMIKDKAVSVLFNARHLGSDSDTFLDAVEDNVLETKVYNIMKDASRAHSTEDLMASGGQLKFEQDVEAKVREEFANSGFELINFTAQLEFSDEVKGRINARNTVSQNVTVIDQQINEQRKQNELAELKAQENIIRARGLTDAVLKEKFIDKWDGKTPIYGNTPITKIVN
jgi:hypothetical protein